MRNALILWQPWGSQAPPWRPTSAWSRWPRAPSRSSAAAAKLPAKVGTALQTADVVVTGADGSAGITFTDNSLVSVGPNSVFAIDKYRFDTTTHAGEFEGNLRQGRLAAVSGKMVKQSPESMKIRTPSAIMGVRGTEFVVQVDEPRR